ncbi:methionine ABC transporter ATP-binding protein [Clostridium cochlearium]|jgi:D-methionine transport system ATP-binding protein|uniref:ABC transporter ATP-binding protein n=1 Tax=Clostridium cochlearium TaxID=1494 RepID=A0A239ZZQ2_CLOCO|nr:methionine ABC transporter ATP-binding protein [Clostridium cochlearium]MBV1821119.1 methionine ABC transporter ATP-binding protein [Bacteroidales bacterium MSK.15.36]NSJ92035.1 methionine ABC transporter ATP-binding protein [Coprococcus sp. MSK.21.13]MBE6064407.1 methionine ABC transporter ATP-binding protein [Clostridium cochlearium]MBU5268854.1 methionine ABC transporter ATP-binding protein [Clostridium cochlearium]MCG4570926.1 methionine ABC transporter ATP-binding protein [Clostridium 
MIQIKDVGKQFGNIKVLKNISLDIKEGEIFGIIGRSGAGKSTLLRCLNGLENYDEGSITVMGKEVKNLNDLELRKLRKDMGMIFQSFNIMNSKNVYDNIALPLQIWKKDKKYIDEKVKELLKLVGLENKAKSFPRELSGGQKQRVAIARALTMEPKVLLCDEATSALDPETTKSILKLIQKINEQLKITVVVVTHQMEVIREICNRIALIDGGEVSAYGEVKDLFLRPEGELKKIIEEEELLPDEGVNIKLFFPSNVSEQSVITSMARELNIDFSIVWGKLESFRQEVLGSLIINIEENKKEAICEYLSKKSIPWEVIK